jgi:hypothetical protein
MQMGHKLSGLTVVFDQIWSAGFVREKSGSARSRWLVLSDELWEFCALG